MINVIATDIPEVHILTTTWFEDSRGALSEVFNRSAWIEAGFAVDYPQETHVISRQAATLRGLHFQRPPMAQAKVVRVIHGAVWDVVVDIRTGSPTYGKWVGVELSSANRRQLLVPVGFAHGYVTLEPHTEMVYKLSETYSPEHEAGIAWDDPNLGISWPLPSGTLPIMAERDQNFPRLANLPPYFAHGR